MCTTTVTQAYRGWYVGEDLRHLRRYSDSGTADVRDVQEASEVMSKAHPNSLDDLAALFVGDGHTPNMFFVSVVTRRSLKVVAVLPNKVQAIEYAENHNGDLIEDRLDGEVWRYR